MKTRICISDLKYVINERKYVSLERRIIFTTLSEVQER